VQKIFFKNSQSFGKIIRKPRGGGGVKFFGAACRM